MHGKRVELFSAGRQAGGGRHAFTLRGVFESFRQNHRDF